MSPNSLAAPKAVSVADAHPAFDYLAVAIDPTLYDDAAIVIVVEDGASEATSFTGKAVATGLVIARTIITRPVDAELELDLRFSGSAEGGCSRNGSGDKERP
ncbi:hypothetical protein [Bosea vaviloviae]|uniref:Uncharacterized protein n=1 Tax=Bosea vaviloviae TaxID=1526658 RepID=A0A1D7U642_9HYPH|nr:hypothetical protein [Bosea vaviloviae]AOO82846.1 hypothetical protein BHK69_22570 [Bosea vaviloviae]